MGSDCATVSAALRDPPATPGGETGPQNMTVACGAGLTCLSSYPTECAMEMIAMMGPCAMVQCAMEGGDCLTGATKLSEAGDSGPSAADKPYICNEGLACFKLKSSSNEHCANLVGFVEGTLFDDLESMCAPEQVAAAQQAVDNGTAAQNAEAAAEAEGNATTTLAPGDTSVTDMGRSLTIWEMILFYYIFFPVYFWSAVAILLLLLGGGVYLGWKQYQKKQSQKSVYGDEGGEGFDDQQW